MFDPHRISSNNHFGLHEYIIGFEDRAAFDNLITNSRWVKPLKIVFSENDARIYCKTNYDKATIERLFFNE